MAESEFISHQQWLQQTKAEFAHCSQSAALDARVLLSYCLQKPLSYLLAWPDRSIKIDAMDKLNSLKKRRLAGEPIAYITGTREFWSINFKVNTDVLIPRPETEVMVEWILGCINSTESIEKGYKVLELGTGSGAIAIALAKEKPALQIIATDKSEKALQVAKENAKMNNCSNVKFLLGNWFECVVDRSYDMIVSNPPYVTANDPNLNEGDLSYEPQLALVAADNGLSDLQQLIINARDYLKNDGWLALEHGNEQGMMVRELMSKNGYIQIQTIKDLAGNDRLTISQWNSDHEKRTVTAL